MREKTLIRHIKSKDVGIYAHYFLLNTSFLFKKHTVLVHMTHKALAQKCTNYVGHRDHSVFEFQIVHMIVCTYKTIKI